MRELALNNSRLDGRYDIESVLGRGSYAEIYIARDTLASPRSPHSQVVIKALNVFLQNDLDSDLERTLVENFQNEAIALDRVRHPNVISRLGHGTARDLHGTIFHYQVLEYLPGGDLARLCREKSLDLMQALDYLEQVCAGLAHAHRSGIIHRDIKPQNLILTEDKKTVKIADFGVARLDQTDSPITRVGTDIYAPPEHSPMLAGQTGTLTFTKLTPAADIYSLAKSAYVLITCESPRFFANQTITELPFAFRQESWADDFLKILDKATRSDARERYQTVSDFWKDLSGLRQFAEDEEKPTLFKKRLNFEPQAHVARGYSPLAPQKPHFNTSRDLKLNSGTSPILNKPASVLNLEPENAVQTFPPVKTDQTYSPLENEPENGFSDPAPRPKNSFFRRAAYLLMFLLLFTGSLFVTYNYLLGRGILPSVGGALSSQTGTANSDINLRPAPSIGNDPIGVVTKNSKVRILSKQDNWFEIDIIEHGRPNPSAGNAVRGWVYGKYIDVVGN